jgi:hypothetical protein
MCLYLTQLTSTCHRHYIIRTYTRQPDLEYEGVSNSFRTGRLERQQQVVQLSATICSCIATLRVSLVSFAVLTFCVASQRVTTKVSVYFVIDSVRKLLDTLSYSMMMGQQILNFASSPCSTFPRSPRPLSPSKNIFPCF